MPEKVVEYLKIRKGGRINKVGGCNGNSLGNLSNKIRTQVGKCDFMMELISSNSLLCLAALCGFEPRTNTVREWDFPRIEEV